jgi:hypothetical protein
MKTLSSEDMQVVTPMMQESPELIHKRREARRKMTTAERQALMTQAVERVDQKYAEKFRQECLDHLAKKQELGERS